MITTDNQDLALAAPDLIRLNSGHDRMKRASDLRDEFVPHKATPERIQREHAEYRGLVIELGWTRQRMNAGTEPNREAAKKRFNELVKQLNSAHVTVKTTTKQFAERELEFATDAFTRETSSGTVSQKTYDRFFVADSMNFGVKTFQRVQQLQREKAIERQKEAQRQRAEREKVREHAERQREERQRERERGEQERLRKRNRPPLQR